VLQGQGRVVNRDSDLAERRQRRRQQRMGAAKKISAKRNATSLSPILVI
jgi:hypothetical protein